MLPGAGGGDGVPKGTGSDAAIAVTRPGSPGQAPERRTVDPGGVVSHLNRLMTGWANYLLLGQVSPAYAAVTGMRPDGCRVRLAFRGPRHDVESRMRQVCRSGSMSGVWKPGGAIEAPDAERAGNR